MTNYPTSLDDTVTLPNPSATNKQNNPSHSNLHSVENDAIKAVEAKLGIGNTTPDANKILLGTGVGTSTWQQLTSAELRGVLSDETGTGAAVFATTPTITTPKIDTINEETSANGVSVDGVILKDGGVTTSNPILVDTISEKTSANGVAVDGVILKDGGITTSNPILVDTISEKTSGNGVSIDSFSIKDGKPKNWNGWITPDETWTYASASSFTIAGVDVRDKYPKGTRLWWNQSGNKWGVVISTSFSTDTTVNIAVNTDYTIANSAITANYYSYDASPQGYPTLFNYTPTLTGITTGSGTVSGKFSITGGLVSHYETFTFGAGSSVGDTVLTLPITSAALTTYTPVADVSILDSGTIVFNGIAIWLTTTTAKIYVSNSGSTYNTQTQLSSTVPMTWTTNDQLIISGTYQA